MEIGCEQDFCFSCCKPPLPRHVLALGAVAIATGIIPDALKTTVSAAFQMAPKISCAAV